MFVPLAPLQELLLETILSRCFGVNLDKESRYFPKTKWQAQERNTIINGDVDTPPKGKK